jgi:hypothetical protein
VIAQDGFLPSAFAHRGRRLIYSHGILVLAGLSGFLVVVFPGITRNALRVALKLTTDVYALHIAEDEQAVLDLEDTWSQRVPQPAIEAGVAAPHLIVIFSPFRQRYGPLLRVVTDLQKAHPGRDIAVIVAELVATNWYHYLLHNQTAAITKAYLLFSGLRRVIVVNVPWYLAD